MDWAQTDLPIGIRGGSDAWDGDAGALLLQDFFEQTSGDGTDDLEASGLSASGTSVQTPVLGQIHLLQVTGLSDGDDAAFGSPSLTQTQSLGATGLNGSSATIGSPVAGQSHVLTSPGFASASAGFGSPGIGQIHNLSSAALASGPAVLATPSLGVVVPVVAEGLATSQATVASPSVAQVHSVSVTSVSGSAASIGSVVPAQAHSLQAANLSTGPSAVPSVAFGQAHAIGATGIEADAGEVANSLAFGQTHQFAFGGLVTSPTGFGVTVVGLRSKDSGSIGTTNVVITTKWTGVAAISGESFVSVAISANDAVASNVVTDVRLA